MLLSLALCAAAAETPVPAASKGVNPHGATGNCEVCHVLPEKKLKGFFTWESEKRKLRADLVALCTECHGVGFGHGVGQKPAMNREKLPLDKDGTITCAVTCHNMHQKAPADPHQEHYHLRLPVDRLCSSCHDK